MQNGIGQTDIRRDTPQTSGSFESDTTSPSTAEQIGPRAEGVVYYDGPRMVQGRAARIAELRESIGRRALASVGVTSAHITSVQRASDVFIVASEQPGSRWAPYAVETFRIPTADNTDPYYEEDEAPKYWVPLAGWVADGVDEVPGMLAKATAYASEVQGTAVNV